MGEYMKKRIILTIIICYILTIVIYHHIPPKTKYYLALGDGLARGMTLNKMEGFSYNDYIYEYFKSKGEKIKFINEYANLGETTESLLLKLNNNYQQEETNISLTQAISKSSLITIWIGMEELSYYNDIDTNIIEEYAKRLNKIIKFIRNYNHQKIIILGTYFYKESPIVNEEIQKIAQNHSLLYVSLDEITNYPSIFFKPNSYELNYKGHELIFNLIKEKLNTTCNT